MARPKKKKLFKVLADGVGNAERREIERQYFFKHIRLYCPKCGHVYRVQEMWEGLAENFLSADDIARVLNCSWQWAILQLERFKLSLKVVGTRDHTKWHKIAIEAGFESPQEMFFVLHVRKQWSYSKILRFLDLSISRHALRTVCQVFLHPKFRYRNPPLYTKTPAMVERALKKNKNRYLKDILTESEYQMYNRIVRDKNKEPTDRKKKKK